MWCSLAGKHRCLQEEVVWALLARQLRCPLAPLLPLPRRREAPGRSSQEVAKGLAQHCLQQVLGSSSCLEDVPLELPK